jgi:hypothetical protein
MHIHVHHAYMRAMIADIIKKCVAKGLYNRLAKRLSKSIVDSGALPEFIPA